ncbi:MAG: hypothetical protein ABI445_19510 [Polyangia bacterium]
MKWLISVDPGIRGCGVAIFNDAKLVSAAYVKNPRLAGGGPDACVDMAREVYAHFAATFGGPFWSVDLAVEWPRVYASRIRAGSSKGDPNDLLALCGVDAAVALILEPDETTAYAPSDWKGQLEKDTCHARIRSRLSPAELAVFESVRPKSLAHNAWDAVGIGLHHLGRGLVGAGRVRVIAP